MNKSLKTQSDLKPESESESLEFKGFINFDSAFGIASAPQPKPPLPSRSPPASLQHFLSRVSGPLFWTFFLFMILIFICYIAYFAFTIFIASFDSQLLSGFAVDALPAPISVILSFFIASHIWIAVVLAFLNFAVSFAAYYFSGKSIQNHFISLLSSAAKPVLWMTILFTVSMIIGYIAGQFYPELFDDLSNSLVLPDGSAFSIMLHIFFNNVRVVFMLIFLGFVLGFLPIMIVVVNGFAIGIVSEYIIRNESFLFLLTGLAPHGIIEIPIILLGAGVGYSSGMTASHVLVKNKTFADFKQSFINATWIFCLLVVPLLFVAAIIEVYVTGALLGVAF